MQDKVLIEIELLNEIMLELRNLRVTNMELHSQLMAVKRLQASIQTHLPSESSVEYVPGVLAKINKVLEKSSAKEEAPKITEAKKK
jgi:hypothetical protein